MSAHNRSHRGGEFVFDLYGEEAEPIWGEGDRVLWPDGEGLMLAGGQGAGKSAVAQQLALARTGVRPGLFLDHSVQSLPKGREVLYLAMDRPRQIQRSLRRMVSVSDRRLLDRRLIVHAGPLLGIDIARTPLALADWVEENHPKATDVIVDSLKDLAVGLVEDEVGAAVNIALQELLAQGRQVLVLHHDRKTPSSSGRRDKTIDDIYGSRWLTAGMGSVFWLDGTPGAKRVLLRHLKQPIEPVGPIHIAHDHTTGTSAPFRIETDILVFLSRRLQGATLDEIAIGCFGGDGDAGKRKARRALNKLVKDKALVYTRGGSGGPGGGGTPARWMVAGERSTGPAKRKLKETAA